MKSLVIQTYADDFSANISLTRLLDVGIAAWLNGSRALVKKRPAYINYY